MASESTNRSSSPMSRENPNPNPNFVRRSANGGNPFPHHSDWCFTPKIVSANSPEFGRRNSFSNNNEHKENKKPNPNLKPIKGAKNFMSPTISAASKITPSSKKKALGERNEAVRASASLSDGKFLFFAGAGDDDLKSETESCEFQEEFQKKEETKKKVTFDDDVVVLSPGLFCDYDVDEPSELIFGNEIAENEPCLDISKTSSFVSLASPIAPLDADPCVQPYDPKTNYLSPRPQFLRYKPNEEVSLNLNSQLLKSFDDTLSSETCSENDMESSVEEAPVEEEELLNSSSNSSSPVKLESSEEYSEGEEETSVESDVVVNSRFLGRWRTIAWLLLFGAVTLLSSMIVSDAPPESVLSKVYQYTHPMYEFADSSVSLHRMKEWSTTYLPLMMSSFRETEEFSPSEFLNSSALICDANDRFSERIVEILTEEVSSVLEETKMDSDSEVVDMGHSEEDQFIEESALPSHPEIESPQNLEAQIEEVEVQSTPFEETEIPTSDVGESPQILEAQIEEVEIQSTLFEETELLTSDLGELEPDSNVEANHEKVEEQQAEFESVIEDAASEPSVGDMDVASQNSHFAEQVEKEGEVGLDDVEEQNSYNTVVESSQAEAPAESAVMFLVASLCVATAFGALVMFSKYKKRAGVKPISTEQDEMLIKKETCNPSEMSSYSYSFNDKKEEEARGYESEAQSKEERKQQPRRNNYKRESLASSSSEYTRGSVSYGSFTTYSVMPTKKGDEEVTVTPVRRSSRIRHQLVSP